MLTVNADDHPVMRQFHKAGDEKRTPVIIAPEFHEAWLSAQADQAAQWMAWTHMPELQAQPCPRK
jgi:uracil-DNA glycosylase